MIPKEMLFYHNDGRFASLKLVIVATGLVWFITWLVGLIGAFFNITLDPNFYIFTAVPFTGGTVMRAWQMVAEAKSKTPKKVEHIEIVEPKHTATKPVNKPKPIKPRRSLVEIARTQLGTSEIPGKDSNAVILNYAKDLKIKSYQNDDTAWCALFAGWVIQKAGYLPTGNLMAKSYLNWGVEATEADIDSGNVIAVFHRGAPGAYTGHVGFVTKATPDKLRILGGNQSDAVTEVYFNRKNLLTLRKPA